LSLLWTKKDVLKKIYKNLIPEVTQSKTSFNFPSLGPKSKRFIPGKYCPGMRRPLFNENYELPVILFLILTEHYYYYYLFVFCKIFKK